MSEQSPQHRIRPPAHLNHISPVEFQGGPDIQCNDYTPGPESTKANNFQYDPTHLPDDDHLSHAPPSPAISRRSTQGSISSRHSNYSYNSYSSNRDSLTQDERSRSSVRSHSPDAISVAERTASSASTASMISRNQIALHRRSPSEMSVHSVMSFVSNEKMLTRELPEPTVFVDKPRKGLACLMCQSIFQDPVIAKCGHTFCRKCVMDLPQGGTCPSSSHRGIVLPKNQLISNITIVEELADMDIRCKFGITPAADDEGGFVANPDGCQDIIKMGDRATHEGVCPYRILNCPNSAVCGTFKKIDLDAHLAVCQHYTCVHSVRGCKFVGSKAAAKAHLEDCRYEVVKGLLQESDSRIQSLSEMLESKDQEIEFLKAMLAKVSDKVDDMQAQFDGRIVRLEADASTVARTVGDMRFEMGQVQNKLGLVDQIQDAATTSHVFKCIGTFVGHQGPVWALAVHGNVIFSGSSDETVKVWDTRSTASFKVKKTLQNHRGIVHALCTHNDILYSGSHDCTINVWDIEKLTLLETLIGHDNPVCTLAVANNLLFSGSLKVVNIWDTHTRTLIGCLSGFNHWVRALVATPDFLFAGSYQIVSIWSSRPKDITPAFEDGEEPKCLESLQTSGGSIYSVYITDQYIICGTYEHLIHIWDGSTLDEVRTLEGHSGTVYALEVMAGSANGRSRLFSASYDRTIRVWCLEQFTCLQILSRHENSVDALTVHRGWLFSGAADSNIKVWQ